MTSANGWNGEAHIDQPRLGTCFVWFVEGFWGTRLHVIKRKYHNNMKSLEQNESHGNVTSWGHDFIILFTIAKETWWSPYQHSSDLLHNITTDSGSRCSFMFLRRRYDCFMLLKLRSIRGSLQNKKIHITIRIHNQLWCSSGTWLDWSNTLNWVDDLAWEWYQKARELWTAD